MNDFSKFLLNKKEETKNLTATITQLYPLQGKIFPDDDAINLVSTNNLIGVSVGSRVLLLKYQNKYIAIAVIGNDYLYKTVVHKTTAQTISSGSVTKVTFTSSDIDYDPLDMFVDGYSRIRVPKGGIYQLSVGGRWVGSSGDSDRAIYAYVSGNAVACSAVNVGTGGRSGCHLSVTHEMATNDYFEMFCYQSSGSDLDFGGTGYYSIHIGIVKL